MRKLKWVVVAVIGLLVVAVVGVVVFLDSIVRSSVEKGASRSLLLATTLGDADVGLVSGDVSLGELKIANPAGFTAPQMLTLGTISVDTSYGKVFGTPTAIDAVVIDRPKLVLEFKGTRSNLKTVADNLASTGGDQPSPSPAPTTTPSPTPPEPAAEPLKLIIDTLRVSGAQVEIISDIAAFGTPYTIDVPAIEMSGIGNADGNRNGEEAGKVVSQIISRLSIEAQKSGKLPPQLAAILSGDLDQLINNIGGKFEEQASQLKAQAMQQVEALKGQAEEAVNRAKAQGQEKVDELKDKAQEQIDKLGGDLGGVLGGDKKDDEKKKK